MSDHSLVLQSVTRLLAGDYTCLAANSESKSTSNPVSLRVRCKRTTSIQRNLIGLTNASTTLQMHQFVRLTVRSCWGPWNMKLFSWSAKLMPHHRLSRSIGHSTHPANRLIYHPNCIRVRWVYKREKKVVMCHQTLTSSPYHKFVFRRDSLVSIIHQHRI